MTVFAVPVLKHLLGKGQGLKARRFSAWSFAEQGLQSLPLSWAIVLVLGACARGAAPVATPVAPQAAPGPVPHPTVVESTSPPKPVQPIAPPEVARALGLMPLEATGVAAWHVTHPEWDGRGVLIAILDSGADPGVPGLQATPDGRRKILDLREFSGEGDVSLTRVHATGDAIVIDSNTVLGGAASVSGLADDSVWYGGVLRELPFGDPPAADFNGNGSNRDRYGIVVFKSGGHWVAMIDTNGDGSLADEAAISDYLVKQETFTFRGRAGVRGSGPITAAVNLAETDAGPRLGIYMDTGSHGTHVTGIAAAHDMYGLAGFDGVAPGAQLIVLKIANNLRGGVSTTGSMVRAMDYAARFADERHLPLVMNMSFGIGNEQEGRAAMDSIVDAFLLAHPSVPFIIAAGNDGPGVSTVGLPGSAERAFTAGAVYPGVFARPQFGGPSLDVMGWWSSRGGELAKPDVVTPGMAYATVPRWNTGNEIKLGTSMAAPYLTGMTALLLSADLAQGRTPSATELIDALEAGAQPIEGASGIDQGAGYARIDRAWQWLQGHHAADRFDVSLAPVRDMMPGMMPGAAPGPGVAEARPANITAFYRRGDLSAADSIQHFRVALLPGRDGRARLYRLATDASWFRPVRDTASIDANTGMALIDVRVDAAKLRRAGRYSATVTGTPAADSAAGPAFRLLGTVIVPDTATGRVLSFTRQNLAGGAVARTFVAVPPGASALAARATLRGDTTTPAQLFVFEPSGRPARTDGSNSFGAGDGASARALLDADDIQPGVYEIDVLALPGHAITYDLEVTVPAVRVTVGNGAQPAVAFTSTRDTTLGIKVQQSGIAQDVDAVIDSGRIWTHPIQLPTWADKLVVEVSMAPGQWNDVTDFAISVFDPAGERIAGDAMNYVFDRVTLGKPEHGFCAGAAAQPCTLTLELFPAFARPLPPARFPARVRVIVLGQEHQLGAVTQFHVPAGSAVSFQLPAFSSRAPAGWSDWLEVQASHASDDLASLLIGLEVRR